MHPLFVAILAFGCLGGGVALGMAVKDMQMKSTEGLKRLLAAERLKGQIEGSRGRGSIEPPKPWNDGQ